MELRHRATHAGGQASRVFVVQQVHHIVPGPLHLLDPQEVCVRAPVGVVQADQAQRITTRLFKQMIPMKFGAASPSGSRFSAAQIDGTFSTLTKRGKSLLHARVSKH